MEASIFGCGGKKSLNTVVAWPTLSALLLLAACGGAGSGSSPTYGVGGSVTGLLPGTSVVLQNNGSNNTPVTVNASFSFSTLLGSGSPYAVTVLTQPTGEKCSVTNGQGVVASANVTVAVTCAPNPYTIGGSITGLLAGNNAVVLDNGGNSTTLSTNGPFTFSASLLSGSTYAVSIATQPTGQSCTVAGGSGTLAGANITTVAINCTVKSYTVSADVFGLLSNTTLLLQDNAGDNLTVSNSGTIAFLKQVPSASSYAVTILTQPVGQTCFVTNGTGKIAGANVTVSVVCPWHVAYIANETGGTISASYIDPVTGALQAVAGSPFSAGPYPTVLAVTPDGKYLLATNQVDTGTVSVFSIAPSTGALTQVAGSPFPAGADPESIVIDPTGRFVYVGYLGNQNGLTDGISAYTINSNTGALIQIPGGQLSQLPGPVPLILDPSGSFLFTWADSYSPATYAVNSASGVLTPVSGSTGFNSSYGGIGDVAIAPNGSFLYSIGDDTADEAVYDETAYTVNSATGALTPVTGNPSVPQVAYIVVAPDSQFAYGADNVANVIWAYSINQTTGALSATSGSPYPVPAGPYPNAVVSAIAVDPSGKFLYVSIGGQVGDGTTGAYTINASSGELTPVIGSPFTQGSSSQGGFSIAITALP